MAGHVSILSPIRPSLRMVSFRDIAQLRFANEGLKNVHIFRMLIFITICEYNYDTPDSLILEDDYRSPTISWLDG